MKKVVVNYKELSKKEKILYFAGKAITGFIYFAILISLTIVFIYSALHNSDDNSEGSSGAISAYADTSYDSDTVYVFSIFFSSSCNLNYDRILSVDIDCCGYSFSGLYGVYSFLASGSVPQYISFVFSNFVLDSDFDLIALYFYDYDNSWSSYFYPDSDGSFSGSLCIDSFPSDLYRESINYAYDYFYIDFIFSDTSLDDGDDSGSSDLDIAGSYSTGYLTYFSDSYFSYNVLFSNDEYSSGGGYSLASDMDSSSTVRIKDISDYDSNAGSYEYTSDYDFFCSFFRIDSSEFTVRLYKDTIDYYLFYGLYDSVDYYIDPSLYYYSAELTFNLDYVIDGVSYCESFTLSAGIVSNSGDTETNTAVSYTLEGGYNGCNIWLYPSSLASGSDSSGDYVDFTFSGFNIMYANSYSSDNDEIIDDVFSDIYLNGCDAIGVELRSALILTTARSESDIVDLVDDDRYDLGYSSGYSDGYSDGVVDGYDEGWYDGYDEAWGDSYTYGYDDGYTAGYAVAEGASWSDPVATLLLGVSTIFNYNIFGYFSLGTLFQIFLYIFVVMMFIKMFSG